MGLRTYWVAEFVGDRDGSVSEWAGLDPGRNEVGGFSKTKSDSESTQYFGPSAKLFPVVNGIPLLKIDHSNRVPSSNLDEVISQIVLHESPTGQLEFL